MLKKSVLAVTAGIICSFNLAFAQESDFKLINNLRYNKIMYDAVPYTQVMKIAIGSKLENVGGFEQDKRGMSGGLPMAFRPTPKNDSVWVLDAINDYLKLFKSGKPIKSISLKKMGFVTDFAFNSEGKMAFLNQNTGNIFITDEKGNITRTINGFESALSIEFANNKELLVFSPLSGGVVRLSINGEILDIYKGDQSLSNYSSEKGLWGLECYGGTVAKLFVIDFVTKKKKILAEIPFNKYKDVEYKGGNIYGFDEKGNVYFGLTACNPDGIIYRDRIYKCNQNGKILKEMDVIDKPVRSPDLPRHRVVCSDGRIMTFYSDETDFYSLHTFPMNK